MATASDIKITFKRNSEAHTESSRVRLHRAISWLARAEQDADDDDLRFILLWVAFNAAYACDLDTTNKERDKLSDFFAAVTKLDQDQQLHLALFGQFTGPIRLMVSNKFVFEPFWRALRDHDSSERWASQFAASQKSAMASLLAGDTTKVLCIVFDRLYVLRNQLVHGGATWNSQINRTQLRDGVAILFTLVPIVIGLMVDHPESDFGPILYPVV